MLFELIINKIRQISLQWILFLFYLCFGLLPLIILSYLTLTANTRSIEETTKLQMQASLTQIGLRIESQYLEAKDDLASFVKIFSLSLPKDIDRREIHDFSKQLLTEFLSDHKQFETICLYNWDSTFIAIADRDFIDTRAGSLVSANEKSQEENKKTLDKLMNPNSRYLPLVYNIPDLSYSKRKTAYILALIPIENIAQIFSSADLGFYTEKTIIDITKQTLFDYNQTASVSRKEYKEIQEYVAFIESLGWTLIAKVPEAVIFKDISMQMAKNFGLAFLVSLAAVAIVFELSRRTTQQIRYILDGTRQFANGNLDYRLDIPVGRELKGLACELNKMAQDLEVREKNLIQTNKLASLGLFTAGIAHEIKNPLAGIKTSAQVLEQLIVSKTTLNEKGETDSITMDAGTIANTRKLATGITTEANRLNKLLKDLVDFSKPDSSKKKWVSIGNLVDRAFIMLQNEFKTKGVKFSINVDETKAFCDPDQFVQILVNLLLNAKNAVAEGTGLVSVTSNLEIEVTGQLLQSISIQDNGQGIPPEAMNKLFDPFFSLSAKGTGLGLSIVYTLAKLNNITINVDNLETGGAAFTLSFPVEENTPKEHNG